MALPVNQDNPLEGPIYISCIGSGEADPPKDDASEDDSSKEDPSKGDPSKEDPSKDDDPIKDEVVGIVTKCCPRNQVMKKVIFFLLKYSETRL
jgi:hypothetical protein